MSKSATGRYSLRERKPATSNEEQIDPVPADGKKKPALTLKKAVNENNAVLSHSTEPSEVKPMSAKKAGVSKPATRKRKRTTIARAENVSEQMSEKQEPTLDAAASFDQLDFFDRQTFGAFLHQIERCNSCYQCGRTLLAEPFIDSHVDCWSSVVAVQPSMPLTGMPCPSLECDAMTCLGCGKRAEVTASEEPQTVGVCCAQGWYTAVWMLLVYFDSKRGRESHTDHAHPSQKAAAAQPKTPKHKNKRRGTNPRPPSGTGYAEAGMDDGDSVSSLSPSQETNDPHRASAVTIPDSDKRECRVFSLLASLLRMKPDSPPSWDACMATRKSKKPRKVQRPAVQVASPTSPLVPMLHWSRVLKAVAELLRNDSIQEACERSAIYTAALDLVEALMKDPETSLLVGDRTLDAFKAISESCRGSLLPSLSFEENSVQGLCELEGVSVANSLENLVVAAGSQTQAASLMPTVFEDVKSQELLNFCRRVEGVGQLLEIADQRLVITPETKEQVLVPLKFDMVDESALTPTYKYTSQANFKNGSNNKRMRTLFQEIGILRSSLPDGVFVRAVSDRPDMLKAVIVGGHGTPYEGGLFEFDILCPMEYPGKPPIVHCVTSASQEARTFQVNPNLYNSGFVCLSLLGTWQGTANESWQAGRSTLLQVLISIQSMILGTPTPANNEPGGLPTPNKEYNKGVQAGTINAAMLGWLKKDAIRNGLWKDVVLAHFKTNASNILATAKTWAEGNLRISKHVDAFTEGSAGTLEMMMMQEAMQSMADASALGALPHMPHMLHMPHGQAGSSQWPALPNPPPATTQLPFMPGATPSQQALVSTAFGKKMKPREPEQKTKVVNLLGMLEEALQEFL